MPWETSNKPAGPQGIGLDGMSRYGALYFRSTRHVITLRMSEATHLVIPLPDAGCKPFAPLRNTSMPPPHVRPRDGRLDQAASLDVTDERAPSVDRRG